MSPSQKLHQDHNYLNMPRQIHSMSDRPPIKMEVRASSRSSTKSPVPRNHSEIEMNMADDYYKESISGKKSKSSKFVH